MPCIASARLAIVATTTPWFCKDNCAFSISFSSFYCLYYISSWCIPKSMFISCVSSTFAVSLISFKPASKHSLPSSIVAATSLMLALLFLLTPVFPKVSLLLQNTNELEDRRWGSLCVASCAAGEDVAVVGASGPRGAISDGGGTCCWQETEKAPSTIVHW